MKHIKLYESFQMNEGMFSTIRRLFDPERRANDKGAREIFEEIKKDFEEGGRNLCKAKLTMDAAGLTSLTYRFGHHDKKGDICSWAMSKAGDVQIKVKHIPTELLLKPNELEKMFGVKRGLKIGQTSMEYEGLEENPKHDKNFRWKPFADLSPEEADKARVHNRVERKMSISADVGKEIVKYFRDEYLKKYPKLKDSQYMNGSQIADIEKGREPVIRYQEFKNKNGKNIIRGVRFGADIEAMKKETAEYTKDQWYDDEAKRNEPERKRWDADEDDDL